MPRILELTKDSNKLILKIWNNDAITHNFRFDPLSDKQQTKAAQAIGCTVPELIKYIEDWKTRPSSPIRLPDPPIVERTVNRRGLSSTNVAIYPDLLSALSGSTTDDVIEWDGTDWLCGLDIDYHSTTPPPKDWLLSVVEVHVQPRPFCWHFSRGGGLHLFYRQSEELTADELAAIAGLRFKQIDSTATIELKRQMRGTQERIYEVSDSNSSTYINQWVEYEGANDKQISDYLESEGFEIGKRYPHERCPISPNVASSGDPVVVGEHGIYCHRCAGVGVALGNKKPGWAGWAALVGHQGSGVLGSMIRNMTHWGHAKWIIREVFGLSDKAAKLAYRAACKTYHPNDDRVNGLFRQEADSFARVRGRWVSVDTDFEWPKDCTGILSSMPVCQYIDQEGKLKALAPRVNLFQQPTVDLSSYGYPELEIIRGCKIYGQSLEYRQPGRLVIELPAKREATYGPQYYAKYVPANKRMSEQSAQSVLNSSLPGIDWRYVYLLLAAKGCWEGRAGLNPCIMVDGPTGSAKTGQILLAAGILGDICTDVVQSADIDRLRAGIRHAALAGTFCAINEPLKDAERGKNKMTAVQALDPILNLTPQSTSHGMYVGPVTMGHPPVMVFTEHTNAFKPLRDQSQIARRCHFVHLDGRKEQWKDSLVRDGVVGIDHYRVFSLEHAEACNAILSYVIDTYFQFPMSFNSIAKELGYYTLEESPEFEDSNDVLRRFFELVCEAPEIEGPYKRRFSGRGYKLIKQSDEDELSEIWKELADGPYGKPWTSSRKLSEKDWAMVLGVKEPIRFDVHTDGQRVAVRFSRGPLKNPESVNGELLTSDGSSAGLSGD